MSEFKPLDVYIDTCSFQKLSFFTDIATLLIACRDGLIQLYASEVLLWERAKHQHASDERKDRLIPYNDVFWKYHAWFKELFKKYNVIVLETKREHLGEISPILGNPEYYFGEEDKRDALLFIVGLAYLEKSTVIITGDKKLHREFLKAGFLDVREDAIPLVQELRNKISPDITIERLDIGEIGEHQISKVFSEPFSEFIPSADHSYNQHVKTLPTRKVELDAFLCDMHSLDDQLRKRILGYVKWFKFISKESLEELLEQKGHEKTVIICQAQILKQNKLLIETENYWLPSDEHGSVEILNQAMAAVMNEILDIMGLS
ncbi:TPA: hypothetical protein JBF73_03565 [Legionella pneumophila]|nr:hypothetical protein [Legionella pneumophila]HRD70345.1 hypothetical protein [Legionella sp.]